MQRFRWELPIQTVLQPLREIFNPAYFDYLLRNLPRSAGGQLPEAVMNEARHKLGVLAAAACALHPVGEEADLQEETEGLPLQAICRGIWAEVRLRLDESENAAAARLLGILRAELTDSKWLGLAGWAFMSGLRRALRLDVERFSGLLGEWRMQEVFKDAVRGMGALGARPEESTTAMRLLLKLEGWPTRLGRRAPENIIGELLQDEDVNRHMKVNIYKGMHWFNQEAFESLWFLLAVSGLADLFKSPKAGGRAGAARLERLAELLLALREAGLKSGFSLEVWLESLKALRDHE